MAKNINWVTTRDEAIEQFEINELPGVQQLYEQDGIPDTIARRESWHNFVDWLNKNYQISDWQAANWSIPEICGQE